MSALPPFTLRCPRCGHPPLPGDRFCGACGSPVPASLLLAWRAWCTPKRLLWTLATVYMIVAVIYFNTSVPQTSQPSSAGGDATVATDTPAQRTPPTVASPVTTRPAVTGGKPLAHYPFPAASTYAAGTPERAFGEYMAAWKAQEWARMARATQLTWQHSDGTPAQTLAGMNDGRRLKGYRILSVTHTTDVCTDIRYECWTQFIGDSTVRHGETSARVMREVGPARPSTIGTWGVNPIIPSTTP